MHPVLYSFHRCPYAMRSRLAIQYSGTRTELREVDLDNIPQSLLKISPKATVPVLVLPDGSFLDESWDIVKWAVGQNDPHNWLGEGGSYLAEAEMLIEMNDFSFKHDLDLYNNADRYPEHPAQYYREQGEEFLLELEERLGAGRYLLGDTISIADVGIFPFVRQFSLVDAGWFEQSPYHGLRAWLKVFLDSDQYESRLYAAIMKECPVWQAGDVPVFLKNS